MFSRFIPAVLSVRVSFLRPSDIPLYGWAPFCVSTPHPLVTRCPTSRGTPDSFPQWPPRLPFPPSIHKVSRLSTASPALVIFHLGEKSRAWDFKGRGEAGAMGGGQSLACVPLCLRSVQEERKLWSPEPPVSGPARGLTAVLLWTNTLHPLSCIPSTAGMESVPSVTSCWRRGSESTTGTAESFHKLYVATHRW